MFCSKLRHFADVSGLVANQSKSKTFSAGVNNEELLLIQQTTCFRLGTFPFKYLGIPILPSRLNVCHYDPLINKMADLIKGWNAKSLSLAGRLELIHAVLQGITNFWLAIFPMPSAVLKRIIALCRNFLWGKSNSNRSKSLIDWRVVCSPKKEEGLCIFSLIEWNLALLAGSLWDIHSKKDSLWLKWVHNVYLKGESIWRFKPTPRDSPWIKCICRIRDIIVSRFASPLEAITEVQS